MSKIPVDYGSECACLAACLVSDANASVVIGEVEPSDFYDSKNVEIFMSMVRLNSRGESVNIRSVYHDLQLHVGIEKGIGDVSYLTSLDDYLPANQDVQDCIKNVLDLSAKRKLIDSLEKARESCFTGGKRTAEEIVELVGKSCSDISSRVTPNATADAHECVSDTLGHLEDIASGNVELGYETQFSYLNRLTQGMVPGSLIVVAGRPGMGKSCLGVNLALHHALHNSGSAAVFSVEMDKREVTMRAMSNMTGIPFRDIRSAKMTENQWDSLRRASADLSDTGFFCNDLPSLTIGNIEAEVAKLQAKLEGGLDVLVIDYIQLVRDPFVKSDRQQEVASITRRLKALAKKESVAVIALCQFNREGMKSADCRPRLEHLRESGAIEQDADVVIGIHREEVYDRENVEIRGEAELIVLKNRAGECATVPVVFSGGLMMFGEFDEDSIFYSCANSRLVEGSAQLMPEEEVY